MKTLTIARPLGFRLDAATAFHAGFTPGSGMAAAAVDRLTLAFRLDGTYAAVAASLREEGDTLVVEIAGTDDHATALAQIRRMLGLEDDGAAWRALGERDPLVRALQAEFPGFFTAAKASPYDAATWAIIAPRMSMVAAARIKTVMARASGDAVTLGERTHHVFPSPAALLRIDEVAGLADEKLARLHGVARAALEGKLDATRLRAMGEDAALAELQTLRGIGPWAASHVYFRGAAPADGLPTGEPRVLRGYALAAGIATPSEEDFRRAAEAWRPHRMWVCVLLSRHLAAAGAWNGPTLKEERARAGRALTRRARGGAAAR